VLLKDGHTIAFIELTSIALKSAIKATKKKVLSKPFSVVVDDASSLLQVQQSLLYF
jgi:hypothetical protein